MMSTWTARHCLNVISPPFMESWTRSSRWRFVDDIKHKDIMQWAHSVYNGTMLLYSNLAYWCICCAERYIHAQDADILVSYRSDAPPYSLHWSTDAYLRNSFVVDGELVLFLRLCCDAEEMASLPCNKDLSNWFVQNEGADRVTSYLIYGTENSGSRLRCATDRYDWW